MRVALISIAGQPREADGDAPIAVAGKTLAHRQLDFALAAGSERVIALGDGASAEATALRHAAQGAGARFDMIRDAHGLLGALGASDELLVLAPGVLTDSSAALEMLTKGNKVVVLPAASGIAAGFERIDLERAWAGAMLIPGSLVERLSELPEDSEPTAALLRVALQARMREMRLPDELLANGSWARVGEGEIAGSRDAAWLQRNLEPVSARSASPWLARTALELLANRLVAGRHAVTGLAAGVGVLSTAAIAASAYGLAALGFGLAGLAALSNEIVVRLVRLRNAPFVNARVRMFAVLPVLVDVVLATCAALAIDGDMLQRLFPALVLLGGMQFHLLVQRTGWGGLLGDRLLLALWLTIGAAFGLAEPAIMLAALAILAFNVANSRGTARITPV